MILFKNPKTLQSLLIALRIIFAMIILRILKTKCLLPKKRLMIVVMRNPMILRNVDGHDATMDDAYEDELAIVPYVKHEIVVIAPTLDCPIILLKSPTHITENFALIKAQCDGLHLSYDPKNRVENNTRVLVGHEQHALCDSYILDVVHDATENYFERGKFGCRNFHVTKTPLFMS